jgi:predicted CopG family antitoxin
MGNITLSIPEELHEKMKQHTELKWSDIARQAFEKKLREIELMEKLLGKSELTEEDAERIGHEIKAKMGKRFKK